MKRKSKARCLKPGLAKDRTVGNRLPLVTSLVVLPGILCFFCAGSAGSEDAGPDVEKTRIAMEKWVETKRILSKEKRDFVLAREMLGERIALVQREIESLRDKIQDAENSIAEADRKRLKMMQENDRLKEASAVLSGMLTALETRTSRMLERLPDPIRLRVKPLSQRLPSSQEPTRLSISERFQNVLGILNEVDKFNREITAVSEVRTMPDGSSVEVAAVYVGIGRGYYSGSNGTVAGIGMATEQGWVWKPCNEIAGQINELMAILKNEKAASYVQVPVEIQ